jgi:hypothetical protein
MAQHRLTLSIRMPGCNAMLLGHGTAGPLPCDFHCHMKCALTARTCTCDINAIPVTRGA